MKATFVSVAVLFACSAMAEEGDETLRKALSASEAVLVGKVATEPEIDTSKEGVSRYRFGLSVGETLNGEVTDKYLKITITRAESDADERLTWLKKKSHVVLFLRNLGDEKYPDWIGVDVSPNVRPYDERLVSSLKRLMAEPPTELPRMEGLVLGEKDGLAQISLGADDGVKPGHVFFWYRGDVAMGQLVVAKTSADTSSAKYQANQEENAEPPKRNDRVVTRAK
ncbi:MAG TPA: hypothetical protein VHC22_00595 [Pirellulales bacterium]|nr:hypothetical protein [Pirellulales bacterium]